jgi:Holliday junction resolvasome RuvABC endonuclease subunit
MLILGLDLSSSLTGWSIIDDEQKLIAFGKIELSKYKKKKFPLEYIKVLYAEIQKIIQIYNIDKCVIEDTFARNISTIKVLCRVRGIAEAALINNGIYDISLINASSARKTVFDNGKLTKEECYEKLKLMYPDKDFFENGYNISDAIVLSLSAIK